MEQDFIEVIKQSFVDSGKRSLISTLRTNNLFIDTIVSTILLTALTYLVNPNFFASFQIGWIHFDTIKSLFFRKYSISFEGKQCYIVSHYDQCPIIASCFSDNFKAIFNDLIHNMNDNTDIFDIQEYITSTKRYSCDIESNMYIIKQTMPILYDNKLKIYATTQISKESTSDSDKRDKQNVTTDKITITLYSYHSTIKQIQEFVNEIKTSYLKNVETARANKRYIYSLKNTVMEDDSGNKQFWNETLFESTRTFSNMFFERKNDILEKIEFFLNNKQWYYDNGIPYTLGIGLYGPPGTGKTSFFKSLANLTGRHLVILSLKEIKTKQKLEEFFFENRYNSENKNGSIGFDKKIIIIEDIDCLGEVVWKREEESSKKSGRGKKAPTGSSVQDVIQKLIENNNSDSKSTIELGMDDDDDDITLDDILNLWDGIKETPGRILGISSNHYNKLDPALIRPGRIDLSIQLDNCSKAIIKEMFEHYYGCKVDMKVLKKIKDKFYSPAEIINCYILNRNSGEAFLNRLLENKKF